MRQGFDMIPLNSRCTPTACPNIPMHRQEREDCRPVADDRVHPSAVRNPGKSGHPKCDRQVVENLAAPARFAGCERDHAIEHVAPEADVVECRGQQEEDWVLA